MIRFMLTNLSPTIHANELSANCLLLSLQVQVFSVNIELQRKLMRKIHLFFRFQVDYKRLLQSNHFLLNGLGISNTTRLISIFLGGRLLFQFFRKGKMMNHIMETQHYAFQFRNSELADTALEKGQQSSVVTAVLSQWWLFLQIQTWTLLMILPGCFK